MPESLDGFAEIQKLRHEVEDLKAITGAILENQSDYAEKLISRLKGDPVLKRVFLLVDGERSQAEIVAIILGEGLAGASRPTIYRKFEILAKDMGLIVFDRKVKGGSVFRRTTLDDALKISRTLERGARR
jgi:hypothetical protein